MLTEAEQAKLAALEAAVNEVFEAKQLKPRRGEFYVDGEGCALTAAYVKATGQAPTEARNTEELDVEEIVCITVEADFDVSSNTQTGIVMGWDGKELPEHCRGDDYKAGYELGKRLAYRWLPNRETT